MARYGSGMQSGPRKPWTRRPRFHDSELTAWTGLLRALPLSGFGPVAVLAALLAVTALVGCSARQEERGEAGETLAAPLGGEGSGEGGSLASATPPEREPGAGARGHSPGKRKHGGVKLTPEQRIAVLKARQAEASGKYAVEYVTPRQTKARRGGERRPVYRASNEARKNRAEFFEEGARVARAQDEADEGVELRLTRWGRDNALAEPAALAAPKAEANRVSYGRGAGLTEWYLNGPAGVEQGFTVTERPPGAGDLVFEVSVSGLGVTPKAVSDGQAVELMTSAQVSIGRYGDLYAEDARGKVIPATLSAAEGRVVIRVDDRDAQYPLVVDPIVWLVEAKLVAMTPSEGGPDGAAGDMFGRAVSVSGDTLVVGAPGDDDLGTNSGAAYVFVRNGSSWDVQQKLVAELPDGNLDERGFYFGHSVSVSRDTLVVGTPGDDDQGDYSGSVSVFVRSGTVWNLQQKLLAQLPDGSFDGATDENFGGSVAVSGDTIVVGASADGDQGIQSGSAYVFVRRGSSWTVQQKLLAQLPDGTLAGLPGEGLGAAVSVSGDTLVVGAPGDSSQDTNAGSAYVFVRSASSWTMRQKLLPQPVDSAPGGVYRAHFGATVSMSADTLVVGAPGADDQGTDSGSAYVFVRTGTEWTAQQKLVAQLPDGSLDGVANAAFGASVSLSGDTLVVGAPYEEYGRPDPASAYVFVRSGSVWLPQQKLLTPLSDGAVNESAHSRFGTAVAASADTLVVGAPYDEDQGIGCGSAYVFERRNSTWSAHQKLLAHLPTNVPSGSGGDSFGISVSMSADTLVVGAPGDDDQGSGSGAAYVFVRGASTWLVQQKIVAELPDGSPDGAEGDSFGTSVSVSGDTLAVGAPGDDDQGTDSGTAYVFVRSGSTWFAQEKLLAQLEDGSPDGAADDDFGASISVAGDTVVVGARSDDDQDDASGSAYVYSRVGEAWHFQQKLLARLPDGSLDGSRYAWFGESLSLSADTLVVGAPEDSPQGLYSGSAYVFVRAGASWVVQQKLLAQLPNGSLDGADADSFGSSLSLSEDTLAVGRPGNVAAGANPGAVYVFVRTGALWTVQQKLLSQLPDGSGDGILQDHVGGPVSLSGHTLVLGAGGDEQGFGSGSAYVVMRNGSTWTVQPELLAQLPNTHLDGEDNDYFGASVAVSGDAIAIGAYGDDDQGSGSGSVYVFRMTNTADAGTPCSTDLACTSGTCLGGVCCAAACDGACHSCVAADTGAADGVCAPIPAGTRCGPDPLTCASTQSYALAPLCDGAGSCVPQSHECLDGFACVMTGAQGLCVSDCRVASGHSGCADAFWCDTDGSCVPDLNGGQGCSFDEQCASGECQGGRCLGSLGEACMGSTDCAGGAPCVDGVCCNDTCAGVCEACGELGSVGRCTPVAAGEGPREGHGTCDGAVDACDGTCDGTSRNDCSYPEGTPCGEASCTGAQISGQLCTASGTCQAGASAPCPGHLACLSATQCRMSCSADSDCAAGTHCDLGSGQCLGDLANGVPCQNPSQCNSGSCVDGVCCNEACEGRCEACDVEGSAGQCTPVPAGELPREGHGTCDGAVDACDGSCDGQEREQCIHPVGAPCGSTSCSGAQITGQLCTATGACQASSSAPCPAGLSCASPTECRASCSSHEHCVEGTYCDFEASQCTAAQSRGDGCAEDRECDSGYCVDGVCCNTLCNQQCEACAEPDQEGTCVAVEGAPRGLRPACGGDGTVCNGFCDGAKRDGCVAPGTGTECASASCLGSAVVAARTCDGAGLCRTAVPQDCGLYACDAEASAGPACLTECSEDDHCAVGAECNSIRGQCVAMSSTCSDASETIVVFSNGSTRECYPYKCSSGECPSGCDADADCARDYACKSRQCVATDGSAGEPSDGGRGGEGGGLLRDAGGQAGSSGGRATAGQAGTEASAGQAGARAGAGYAGEGAPSGIHRRSGGCGCVSAGRAPSWGVPAIVAAGFALLLTRMRRRGRRADGGRRVETCIADRKQPEPAA